MTVLVSAVQEMIRKGRGVRAVACASTGDTSARLRRTGRRRGCRRWFSSRATRSRWRSSSSRWAQGRWCSRSTSDFDGCMRVVQALADEGGVYLANSMNSPRPGQKTVAVELVQRRVEAPDWW